jgi:RecA-family ATPase
MPIESAINGRGLKLSRSGAELVGPCPVCGDGVDRFSINPKKGKWFCRHCDKGGGDAIGLVRFLDGTDFPEAVTSLNGGRSSNGADKPQIKPDREPPPKDAKKVLVAEFTYQTENGDVAYVVPRHEFQHPDGSPVLLEDGKRKKTFSQRRPDGAGGWIWNMNGVQRVPYHLPELIEAIASDFIIFIAEGEAKVEALHEIGIIATCCAGGAGKWQPEFSERLRGADVVLLPDNDDAGWKHINDVGASLVGIAKSIRVIVLPNLPPKGDIIDWIKAGGTREQLDALVGQAPDWVQADEASNATDPDEPAKPKSLQWLDMSNWDNEPVPQRKWAIRDRVPLNQAGLFSGEGGTGKSIIELMKNVAHVTGKDWLGSMPEPGPAFYLGAEDDINEIHIRLAAIAQHYGVTFKQLIDDGLHVLPLLGQDATLCAVSGKSGRVEVTDLYRQLYEAAGDIKPMNISIDTLSRAFAGNEIDRVQVYAFAMHMQALAMVAGGAVTVLSHPSLAGIASGSGISGSTAWHGAFRFRQYLKGTKADAGEQPDNDLRELEFKKNQYGPIGEAVAVRYQRGLFMAEPGAGTIERAAAEQKAEELFLTLLGRFNDQGRNVSDKSGTSYAPALFAEEAEAKAAKIGKTALAEAMTRLFAAGKLHMEPYGYASRGTFRIAVGPKP